jgi:putative phosphoribosyl transferase
VRFADRIDAGRRLASRLEHLRGQPLVVLGLPRGGVPVAAEVARALGAPLDVILVRKLGAPYQPEFAMGAIGEDGVRVLNQALIRSGRLDEHDLARVEASERSELERRAQRYRGGRPRLDLTGRVALVVDDGIATGSTVRAACLVARAHGARRVVVAAPVGPPGVADELGEAADEVVLATTPWGFHAIGQFYDNFSQTSDEEVEEALASADLPDAGAWRDPPGELTIPAGACGIVLFVHGSGSSRYSPRNRHVAHRLQLAGLGTFLFDLLTEEEAAERSMVFDIVLLSERLLAAMAGVCAVASGLRVGLFGASTGAAAALWAAADPALPCPVDAIVSRGGRPDLAGPRLADVRAPTLLVVGGRDEVVMRLNQEAMTHLRCEHELAVVPGATHLFEEPGTLDAVAELAQRWFVCHLGEPDASRSSSPVPD